MCLRSAARGCAVRWRQAVPLAAGLALMPGTVHPTLAAPAVSAEPGPAELQLVARTLGFLTAPPSGTVDVGVVYPAASAAGRADAEGIAAALGDRVVVDDLTLKPRPVTLEEAGRGTMPVLLLTSAALPQAGALAALLAGKHVLTASTEPSSVDASRVVIAVRAQPDVEIFVSQAAAKLAGLQFSSAFRMLIQER